MRKSYVAQEKKWKLCKP